MPPFLEILTRCYKRPRMFAINQTSLWAQTDPDWVQTLLVDDVGRGIAWATENMAAYAPKLVGDYILILDDDDMLICPTLVADLKCLAAEFDPDVIMLRMDHGGGVVLPDDDTWGQPPVLGRIGCSAFVVRRAVWAAHAGAMVPGQYHSDFLFIESIWHADVKVYWHNCVASRIMRQSFGQPEVASPWAIKST